jgi:1-deoxy-D-xylulose-5-phosphate synthase
VVFAIDRAGLVGSDGETHQGIFDFTYLTGIPNMHVCAPKNKWELSDMLKFALQLEAPVAIRYPRGNAYDGLEAFREPVVLGKAEWIFREEEIALLAVGSMVKEAEKVRDLLKAEGHKVSLINARFVKPIDEEVIEEVSGGHRLLVTMEENVFAGGYGEKVLDCLNRRQIRQSCLNICIPDAYVEHGNVELLKQEIGIDAVSITRRIKEYLKEAER